jgi:inorganic triphosphatase YgiF
MLETELKLQVPPASRHAVVRALERGRTARVHLCALYFDTPDDRLAAAGLAARVRREGRHWVQAVKGTGDGLLARLELEVSLPATRDPPAFDPARHAGSPVHDALLRALGHQAPTLALRFETDVWRVRRELRAGAARIEIAFDEGVLRAGERTLPVSELELELRGGPVSGLIETASRWAARHGLWLDLRSKAERGHWLATGPVAAPVTKSLKPGVSRGDAPAAALRECVRCALVQVLANGSWLAAGAGQPEHVHQARVGLRRLTTLLREFGSWSAAVDPQCNDGARAIFKALSATRDRDALASWLWPQLRAVGASPPSLGAAPAADDPAEVFRAGSTTQWLLRLLAFVQQPPALDGAGSLRSLARPRLALLHRQIRRAGHAFDTMDDAARHRARKRLKRLRYAAESLSSLWPEKPWTTYVQRLREAQEALGHLQDVAVAEGLLREAATREVDAAFAMGWLAARRDAVVADAGRALAAIGALPKFLR